MDSSLLLYIGEGENVAEKRMFAKTIIDSDAFIDMPVSARLLYYDLGMRADDDGFVNSPKKIMRMINATDDDMRLLIAKKFIIPFENGIVVIKHWRINNYLRADRYKETTYLNEKALLRIDENGAYTTGDGDPLKLPGNNQVNEVGIPSGIPTVNPDKNRLDKNSIDKINNKADKPPYKKFVPPTLEDVTAYCKERNNSIDPQKFIDHYTANGWVRGKTKIKDWKACVRTWEGNQKQQRGEIKYADFTGIGSMGEH